MEEGTESENQEGIGSVRAAISFYGERINGRKQEKLKAKAPLHNSSSKAGELHVAKIGFDRLNESRLSAEKERARAEAELSSAKSMAKELARKIEEANSKTRAKKSELHTVRMQEPSAKKLESDRRYEQVIRELEDVKQELSRLKLDSASALEAKAKAEKEFEASSSKALVYSQTMIEELKEEIQEANEEHVLVEIARIEADRERREIEVKRQAEAAQFTKHLEAAKKRIEDLKRETNRTKELESKLAVTKLDVLVLQNEMELVGAMERKDKESDSQKEDLEGRSMLQSAQAELDAAKKELAAIKEEGFQFMASMDQIRKEMLRINEETEQLKKLGKKADSYVQYLNTKLLKAKSKLESATLAEERTKGIVSNLSSALQHLKNEIEGAKKEKETIDNETQNIRSENEKADVEISTIEERLQAAVKELQETKASELVALKKLKIATEKAMKARASAVLKSSTLTISKSEYDYLSKRAAAAQAVADKKVAASRVWIEALRAGEKEMLMRADHFEKQMRKARAMEKQKLFEAEKILIDKQKLEEQVHETNWTEKNEEDGEGGSTLPAGAVALRKSFRNENGNRGRPRRSKMMMMRVSASSATRNTRSPSFTIKKRRKVMLNLVKFLRDHRRNDTQNLRP